MHRKHQDPCINVSIASQQEWLFFLKAQTKHCLHTTLKLGDQGCLTVLASSLEFKLSWLAVLLKNPVCVYRTYTGRCLVAFDSASCGKPSATIDHYIYIRVCIYIYTQYTHRESICSCWMVL